MSNINRIYNCKNPYQDVYKKVLAVCSAGLLRSPSTAVVLSQPPYNYNTRAAGLDADHALIPVDEVLLQWADEIVCMTEAQKVALEELLMKYNIPSKPIICLNILDGYAYRDPKLLKLIKERYDQETKPSVTNSDPIDI